jgi:RNA polymerase sigma factor (sigma-70 family)
VDVHHRAAQVEWPTWRWPAPAATARRPLRIFSLARKARYSAIGTRVSLPDLLQRFASGDPEAFFAIYAAHAGEVRALVARHFARAFEREEAVQEVWLQVHRVASRFDPARGQLRPWLQSVATNRCRELLRARGRRPLLSAETDDATPATTETPETVAQGGRVQAAIARFRATLTSEEAEVFRLGVLEERSHDEVAVALGISPRRAKYLKLKLLDRAASTAELRALLREVGEP